jgi:hypothetical protein
MQIAYIDPLSKACERTKKALFQPFDIRKWFVVGFTAFLAGLINGSPSMNFPGSYGRGDVKMPDIERMPERAMEWMSAHPFLVMLILIVIVFILILALIFTWLSSRGAFMFLDNVAGNRAQVAAPWRQYKSLGDSLFLWRIGFGLICFLITLPMIILGILTFLPLLRTHNMERYLLPFIGLAAATLIVIIVASFIAMFANNFVAPIMYKFNLKAMAAWRLFIPILSSYLFNFICYGLFVLALIIGVGIAVILVGCLTCCLLFLLLLIPYINSVVLLPISYAYRAFSLEFLAQFGPEYNLFPIPQPPLPEPMVPDPNPAPVAPA